MSKYEVLHSNGEYTRPIKTLKLARILAIKRILYFNDTLVAISVYNSTNPHKWVFKEAITRLGGKAIYICKHPPKEVSIIAKKREEKEKE